MKKGNKKVIIGAIVFAVLLIGGIGIGVAKSGGATASTPVSIAKDTSYDKLLSGVDYKIPKKDIVKTDKKVDAKFNVVSKDLTADQTKDLAKKIYENTVSKQKGLTSVEVYVFDKDEKASDFVNEFYADGLKFKAVYDKEFNTLTFSTFNNVPNVTANVTKAQYAINDVKDVEGVVKVDIAMTDGLKNEDVMAETKGLLDQIKAQNPSKKVDVQEATITGTTTSGWEYNTKFNDIISTTEKSTIN
jgi:hypothetical protein